MVGTPGRQLGGRVFVQPGALGVGRTQLIYAPIWRAVPKRTAQRIDRAQFSHAFDILSSDEADQAAGQALYAELRHATGILEPEDTSDFIGKPLYAVVKAMGRIEYAAL
jgi:hypothetical protein